MKVVIDTNILISAIIRDSKIREIIINSPHEFFTSEIIFEELKKYQQEIEEKSGLSSSEISEIINVLFKYIKIIPTEDTRPFVYGALRAIGEFDEEDSLFIACALHNPGSVIWSNDKHFKMQNKIKVYNISDFIHELEK